jgi:pimeloyl-ACP methyl ester carboxylesterase
MGGGVAALQAAREPASAAALILSSSFLPPDFRGFCAPIVGAGILAKRVRGIVGSLRISKPWQGDTHWVTESSLRTALADPGSIPQEVVAAELELHDQRPEDRDANRTAAEAITSLIWCSVMWIRTRRLFASIACPTLVLHGESDPLVPPDWAEIVVRGRPNWRLATFPGADHPVHLRERDRWLAAVREWLDASSLTMR